MAGEVGTVLIWIVAGALVAGGFAGLIVPGLPGAPLLWAGFLVGAWAEDFRYVGWPTLALLALLAAGTWAADFAASALGARRVGASGRAVLGATIGGIVGVFFGLPGLLLGPFAGAVAGELSMARGLRQAGRAGLGATLGLALGLATKLALGVTMLGVFALDRFAWN